MNIKQKLITNLTHFRKGRQWHDGKSEILEVVLHTYNGVGSSLYGWFQNGSANTSSHYAIFKEGSKFVVEQYVKEEDTAYANGHFWANAKTISIEHQDNGKPEAPRPKGLYNKSIELVYDIMKRRGITSTDRIKIHKNFTSTGCPGMLDVDQIKRGVQALIDEAQGPSDLEKCNTKVKALETKIDKMEELHEEQIKGWTEDYEDLEEKNDELVALNLKGIEDRKDLEKQLEKEQKAHNTTKRKLIKCEASQGVTEGLWKRFKVWLKNLISKPK